MSLSDYARVLLVDGGPAPPGPAHVPAAPEPEPVQLSVTIDVPTEGATLTTGEAVTLSGTVSSAGAVVAISLGVTSLGNAVVDGESWSLAVTPDSGWLGAQALTATATESGKLSGSDTANVVGAAPAAPTASIVAPLASAALLPLFGCTIAVACTGATSVEVFRGATSLGTATPVGGLAFVSWVPDWVHWGTHSLTAVATGPGGQVTSAAVSVTVGTTLISGWVADAGFLGEADTTTPEDTDALASWTSLNGAGNGSAAANRPAFVASDSTLNGKSSALFVSASSQRMPVNGIASAFVGAMGASHTIITAMRPTSITAATFFSAATTGSVNGHFRWLVSAGGFIRYLIVGDGAASQTSSSTALPSQFSAGVKSVFSVQFSTVTRVATLWIRGVRFNAGAISSTPGQITPNNATIFGHSPAAFAEPMNGALRAMLVLAGVDNTTVRENFESVLWAEQGSVAPGVGEYDTSAYAVHGFSTSGYYRAPAIALPKTIGVLFRYTSASALARALVSAFQGTGYEVTLLATGAIQVTGASSTVITTALAVQDQWTAFAVSDDGAGNLNTYMNRGVVQTWAATISDASHELVVGARSTSRDTPATDVRIAGVVIGSSSLNQAGADLWFDACKNEQGCAALETGTVHRWNAKDRMSNLSNDATWVAENGSVDLQLYGTVAVGENIASVQSWGWT